MKISKDRLIQIIKEELDNVKEGQSDMLNHPSFLDPENHFMRKHMLDDPEEEMMSHRAEERIREIDAEIATLEAEKENLLTNLGASRTTQNQIDTRGIYE